MTKGQALDHGPLIMFQFHFNIPSTAPVGAHQTLLEMFCSIKYLLAILTLNCCHRDDSAISSRRDEERILGAIELTDGTTIHWGEQTLALQKLKTAGVAYSLGEAAVGMADLWCSSADYDKALALLGTLGDSNSSGFHPAHDFAGLTKEQMRYRANEVAHPMNQTEAESRPGE